jgi:two-component system chemotaxis response regulator CheB
MNETTKVFALLGDAQLRRQLQQQWRGNGMSLCGMHAEGGDSIVEEIGRVRPDLVLVDADLDGARQLVQAAAVRHRLPVVALVRAQNQGFASMRPLEWGAVAVAAREVADLPRSLVEIVDDLRGAQVVDVLESQFPLSGAFPDATVFDLRRALQGLEPDRKIVAVCAGAGGPLAMRRILGQLRRDVVSPIVYAQRAPEALVSPLVQWLEHHTGASVRRAADGRLEVGTVYVVASGHDAVVEMHQGEPHLRVTASDAATTPCFDSLMESVAQSHTARAVAVLLSGRGADGSHGLLRVRRAGGFTIVQDRASSLVYDAPGQARDAGGAIECLPINEIAERLQMLMRPEPVTRP